MSRKRAGSEFSPSEISRRSSIRPEEADQLEAVDVENLESKSWTRNYCCQVSCVKR